MGIDTDGQIDRWLCEEDRKEEDFGRAYDHGIANQADWLTRNRASIENLLSDYASDVKDGIGDDLADDVYIALDHPFDLPALRALGIQIGG